VRYETYESLDEARQAAPYRILTREELMGVHLSSYIRWLDANVDVFVQAYVAYTPQPDGAQVADRWLMLFQGHGSVCTADNSGAPRAQRGAVGLDNGRRVFWAEGVDRKNWRTSPGSPVWAAWESKEKGIVRRLEAVGFDLSRVRDLAVSIAASE